MSYMNHCMWCMMHNTVSFYMIHHIMIYHNTPKCHDLVTWMTRLSLSGSFFTNTIVSLCIYYLTDITLSHVWYTYRDDDNVGIILFDNHIIIINWILSYLFIVFRVNVCDNILQTPDHPTQTDDVSMIQDLYSLRKQRSQIYMDLTYIEEGPTSSLVTRLSL